jgi:hypothetical protein
MILRTAQGRAMRQRLLFLALLLTSALMVRLGWAQEPAAFTYSRYRQFRIPFNPPSSNIKQLQLYVSTDQGKTWVPSATAPPDQKHFRFISEKDGYFWFTVQTTDLDNKLYPANLDNAQPSLKVIIDTVPPRIALQPLPPRGGEVGVGWEITDENLDLALPDAARLEYRVAGGTWLQLPMPAGDTKYYWNPQAGGQIEVRLRARDRAGNANEALTTVSLTGNQGNINTSNDGFNGNPIINQNPKAGDAFNPPADAERKLVNSKRVTLNYELKEVGPSGVSGVELWYTQDGRGWNKYPVRFGEDGNLKHITFDVVGEGLYGLTLVAKSGVGLGERTPQIGDRPQLWIEVDLTKPAVQLHNVLVGTGPDKGKLNITWTARDKNLARDPITLSYAENAAGPWTPFAEKLANTGRYIWNMPERIPYQFHLKVEALDAAGNIGDAVTESQIKVDLSQPKVKILTVEPAGK